MKKFISIILFLFFSLSEVFAAQKIGELYYNLNNTAKTAEVTAQYLNGSSNYSGLESVSVPATVSYSGTTYKVTSIGNNAFSKSKIKSITISSGITTIGTYAFYQCFDLKTVSLPNTVTVIGNSSFYYCQSLSSISLPQSVQKIDSYAFYNCVSLKEIKFPSSLNTLEASAFANCSSLQKVTFNGTKSLNLWTSCLNTNSISEIYCYTDVPPSGQGNTIFSSQITSSCKLYVPENLVSLYSSKYPWSNFSKIIGIKINADKISLNQSNVSMDEGETKQLTATITPSYATEKITWTSSNDEVATVSSNGLVKGVSEGTAVITANCGSVSAKCTFKITKVIVNASKITLSTSNLNLEVGTSQLLTALVEPSNTTDPTVKWTSSNDAVATVTSNGLVYAISPGSAIITAQCGSVKAICNVTVPAPYIPATRLSLNMSSMELKVGATAQLTATVEPANATDKTIIWTSADPSIATVSENGLIKCIDAGSTVITATCGNLTAECSITVSYPIINPSKITLNESSLSLYIGSEWQLTAVVEPINTTDKTVKWTSSNDEVVYVSQSGLVTGLGIGNATVTAQCGTVSATCDVSVSEAPIYPAMISLNLESLELSIGSKEQLLATVEPENTTDKTILWSSSDDAVATVSETGLVWGVSEGTAIIKAECQTVSALCQVTVTRLAGIDFIIENEKDNIDVYSLQGVLIYRNVPAEKLKDLCKGIYLIKTTKGSSYKIII